MLGTVIAERFRLERELGDGTMGQVYEAVRLRDGMPLAVKLLRPDLGDEIQARFVREGKALALFDHRNIIRFVEAGIDGPHQYLATELVRGVTLRDLMASGPIETRRALQIARQVLEALGHVHDLGVVHRDLKPENIMLVDGGSPTDDADFVKVLDFGVAKLANDTAAVLSEMKLTRTGFEAFGTALYMPPEVALGRAVETRSDLYSLGAILFEMLAQRPLFDDQDVAVLMRKHAAAKPPTLGEVAPHLQPTPQLELVIAESLAKSPELRFKSAADMIAAIDAALASLDPVVEPTIKESLLDAVDEFVRAVETPRPTTKPGEGTLQFVPPPPAKPAAPSQPESIFTPFTPTTPATPAAPQPIATAASPSSRMGTAPTPKAKPGWKAYVDSMSPRTKRYALIGAGSFLAIVILAVALSGGDSKPAGAPAVAASTRDTDLAKRGTDLIATGNVAAAADTLEMGLANAPDDAAAHLALGHARTKMGQRAAAVAAYERAIAGSKALGSDPKLQSNLATFFDGKDAVSAAVALEIAVDIGQRSLVLQQASTNKTLEIRHRAIAIAEREGFADQLDRVDGWTLDLVQLSGCEAKRAIVAKLRTTDARAIPALKRARSLKCIEKDVAEALTFLEASKQ